MSAVSSAEKINGTVAGRRPLADLFAVDVGPYRAAFAEATALVVELHPHLVGPWRDRLVACSRSPLSRHIPDRLRRTVYVTPDCCGLNGDTVGGHVGRRTTRPETRSGAMRMNSVRFPAVHGTRESDAHRSASSSGSLTPLVRP